MPGVVFALLGLGAVVTVGFMLFAGEPQRPLWWLGFLPFAAWALLPYFLTGRLTSQLRTSTRSLWVLAVAAGLLTASSACLLYLGFVAEPDAQSGLLFLFLPLWQLVALFGVRLVALTVRSRDAAA